MRKAAVIVESWKRLIFLKNLIAASYSFEEVKGLTEDTLVLKVDYKPEDTDKLVELIRASNKECARSKMN